MGWRDKFKKTKEEFSSRRNSSIPSANANASAANQPFDPYAGQAQSQAHPQGNFQQTTSPPAAPGQNAGQQGYPSFPPPPRPGAQQVQSPSPHGTPVGGGGGYMTSPTTGNYFAQNAPQPPPRPQQHSPQPPQQPQAQAPPPPAPSPGQVQGGPQKPGDPFRSRGDTLAASNDYNSAVVMYDSALAMAPHDVELLLARALAHSLSAPARLDLAANDSDAAIQSDPTNWLAWLQKGEVLTRMGRRQEAEEACLNALGFADGMDKLTVQRTLAAARSVPENPQQYQQQQPQQQHQQQHHQPPQQQPPRKTDSNPPQIPTIVPTPPQQQQILPSRPAPTTPTPPLSQPQSPPQQQQQQQQRQNRSSLQTPPTTHQRSPSSPSLVPPAPPPPRSTSPIPAASSSQRPQNPQSSGSQPSWNTAAPANASSIHPPHPAPAPPQQGESNRPQVPRNETTNNDNANFLSGINDILDVPDENPPAYTENLRDPVVLNRRMDELETSLATKNKGALAIRPYTAPGNIDALKLTYIGLTALQLTARELGTPTYPHPSFDVSAVTAFGYPGNNFIDQDCETSPYYDGKIPGTTTVSGYSEEYRAQQLTQIPLLTLTLESNTCLPEVPLSQIITRIRRIKYQPSLEEHQGLCDLLRLSQLEAVSNGFTAGGSRQKQIECITKWLNRSRFDAPTRFTDFSKARSICTHFLGAARQGTGLRNFLYQMLLGCELLIRLRKEPVNTSYAGLITDASSALLVLGALWMENVTIDGPTNSSAADSAQSYVFIADKAQVHTNGLIRFAESLRWPFMDEARRCLETAYSDMIAKRLPPNNDMWDWFFGLMLPGKIFRHRIMCALVHATPSLRNIGPPPFYENGLVAGGKSYWPRRTVLGRVLGTRRGEDVHNTCGWVGPCPAPKEAVTGWIRLSSRRTEIPVPVRTKPGRDALADYGFDAEPRDTFACLDSLFDPNEWAQASVPVRQANDTSRSELKALHLTELPPDAGTAALANAGLPTKQYQASLDFLINGSISVTYTLYSNAVFVTAPPCVGTHVLHRKQAEKYLKTLINVADLKNAYPRADELLVIKALGPGEETVARAWCAERGWNAVIWHPDCCFSCAAAVSVGKTGLGCNVLILS